MMGEHAAPRQRAFEGEEELASALAEHDARAWQQLFEEQYQRVYNYAYLRTGNTADADDIAANVFTEAVRGIRKFSYRGLPVASWLFRIAHNETADLLKRRSRTATTSLENPEAASALHAPDDNAHSDEWRAIADAIGALRPEHRDVLVLRLIEGRSVNEVARILSKTEAAVKVMQMRALKTLRGKLGE